MKARLAVALLAVTAAHPATAGGDPVKGEKVFRKCTPCHTIGEDAGRKPATAPTLNNLFGRTAGADKDYSQRYSNAMIEAGRNGLVWTEETLLEYLERPKVMLKKSSSAFTGRPWTNWIGSSSTTVSPEFRT